MYFFGKGVSQDFAQAARSYWLLAEQDSAHAQYLLGYLYEDGKGVAADPEQVLKWYRLAAQQGEPRAQSRLVWMLWEGKGVAQDAVAAHMWSNLAASRLCGEGGECAGKMRDFIASKLSPEQLTKAQAMARDWAPVK